MRKEANITGDFRSNFHWATSTDDSSKFCDSYELSQKKLIKDKLFSKESFGAIRVSDANLSDRTKGVVTAVDFCPDNRSILLTAGFDRKLRLFEIGKQNLLKSSILFEDLPLQIAKFSSNSRILLSGNSNSLYVFDILGTSNVKCLTPFKFSSVQGFEESPELSEIRTISVYSASGTVSLISSQDYVKISTLQAGEDVCAASYSNDGRELFLAGGNGSIFTWDLRKMRCKSKNKLGDSQRTISCAYSVSDQMAVGTRDGIVRVFSDWNKLLNDSEVRTLEPTRHIMSLRTAVDNLTFSSDGQLLSLSSSISKDAVRIAHQPSCTLYSNWPTSKTPLSYVFCTAFSRDNRYLALGNARGRVLLYRLISN